MRVYFCIESVILEYGRQRTKESTMKSFEVRYSWWGKFTSHSYIDTLVIFAKDEDSAFKKAKRELDRSRRGWIAIKSIYPVH
jgi:hypothetical protein